METIFTFSYKIYWYIYIYGNTIYICIYVHGNTIYIYLQNMYWIIGIGNYLQHSRTWTVSGRLCYFKKIFSKIHILVMIYILHRNPIWNERYLFMHMNGLYIIHIHIPCTRGTHVNIHMYMYMHIHIHIYTHTASIEWLDEVHAEVL